MYMHLNSHADKPRQQSNIPRSIGRGNYLKEHDLPCPMTAKPNQIICSWDVNWCNRSSVSKSTSLGITYPSDNNCTLHIDSLTIIFQQILFSSAQQ